MVVMFFSFLKVVIRTLKEARITFHNVGLLLKYFIVQGSLTQEGTLFIPIKNIIINQIKVKKP